MKRLAFETVEIIYVCVTKQTGDASSEQELNKLLGWLPVGRYPYEFTSEVWKVWSFGGAIQS